jgi:CubicO group peptidase (beta-lactamase class C family)
LNALKEDVDRSAIAAAVEAQLQRPTPGIEDITAYLARQVADPSHREVIGPLLSASGASGLIVHLGESIAQWGDPAAPEMLFSATKSLLSTVAGVAFDLGLFADVDRPVVDSVALDQLATTRARAVTWRHLLHQTSGWQGVLWDKPTSADAQSQRPGSADDKPPGQGFAYNDVRINLLCLALTALFGEELDSVLKEHVLGPLGASASWSWHGYSSSFLRCAGDTLKVVSGGAHWGGGLWMSARDLALVGQLYLQEGRWHDRQILSKAWISSSFEPCAVNPDYGFLWWLNDAGRVFPSAPFTGRCARGNGGKHLLWVDPARALVVVSRWGDDVGELLRAVSAAIPTRAH